MNQHPQEKDPARPTPATDPQEAEISGNVFKGLGISADDEDREKLQQDKPLEDMPQTGPAE